MHLPVRTSPIRPPSPTQEAGQAATREALPPSSAAPQGTLPYAASNAAGSSRARKLRVAATTARPGASAVAAELKAAIEQIEKRRGLYGPIPSRTEDIIPEFFFHPQDETVKSLTREARREKTKVLAASTRFPATVEEELCRCTPYGQRGVQIRRSVRAAIAKTYTEFEATLKKCGVKPDSVREDLASALTRLQRAFWDGDKAKEETLEAVCHDVMRIVGQIERLQDADMNPSDKQQEIVGLKVKSKDLLNRRYFDQERALQKAAWRVHADVSEVIRLRTTLPGYGLRTDEDRKIFLALNGEAIWIPVRMMLCNDYYTRRSGQGGMDKLKYIAKASTHESRRAEALASQLPEEDKEYSNLCDELTSEVRQLDRYLVNIERGIMGVSWAPDSAFTPRDRKELRLLASKLDAASQAYEELSQVATERAAATGASNSKELIDAVESVRDELKARKFLCDSIAFNLRVFADCPAKAGEAVQSADSSPASEAASQPISGKKHGKARRKAKDAGLTAAPAPAPAPAPASVSPDLPVLGDDRIRDIEEWYKDARRRIDYARRGGERIALLERRYRRATVLSSAILGLEDAEASLAKAIEVYNAHRQDDDTEEKVAELKSMLHEATALNRLYTAYLASPKTRNRTQKELAALAKQDEVRFSFPRDATSRYGVTLGDDRIIEIQVDHKAIAEAGAPIPKLEVEPRFIHMHLSKGFRPGKKDLSNFDKGDFEQLKPEHIVAVHEKDRFSRRLGRYFEERAAATSGVNPFDLRIEREPLDRSWSLDVLKKVVGAGQSDGRGRR